MTKHISDIPREPLRGAGGWGPSLDPPVDEPELPALSAAEIKRAEFLGMTQEQAFAAKITAYGAEARHHGIESIEAWLRKRPAMQRAGVVPPGPPAWPIAPEPTTEDLARRNDMTVDRYTAWGGVQNLYDAERVQGELARKAEVEAEARHQLELEQAKRRIAAEQSGDEAA